MTQRIFDVDNPQDVKDLFDILPDAVKKIYPDPVNNEIEFYDKDGVFVDSCAHIRVNWHGKEIAIVRPVDESQLIGKLCWFTGSGATCEYIGVLKAIVKSRSDKYQMENGGFYSYCRPVRRDEIKFVEDVE